MELLESSHETRGASLTNEEEESMGVNSVTLVGRAGRDPEVRLSHIHISQPTRLKTLTRMPSSA